MSDMKPSIGRIVHYQSYGTPNSEFLAAPRAAIIADVDADGSTCSVVVFNPQGLYFNKVPYSAEPVPGHWNWPPRA